MQRVRDGEIKNDSVFRHRGRRGKDEVRLRFILWQFSFGKEGPNISGYS